jgi:hypothetical protein
VSLFLKQKIYYFAFFVFFLGVAVSNATAGSATG